MKWFNQPATTTAHFYRILDDLGNPVPFCRKQDDLPGVETLLGDAPLGASGGGSAVDYPSRDKRPIVGFSKPPENLAEGYQLLLMTQLRPCKRCLHKLPENVAQFFSEPRTEST